MIASPSRDRVIRSNSHGFLGITITETIIAIAIISLLLFLLLPAVQQSRETARRLGCLNNLKQIGTAFESYNFQYRMYPVAFVHWPMALLPYLDQPALYSRIEEHRQGAVSLDELMSANVPIYACPSDSYAQKYRGWSINYPVNDGYWPPKNKYNGFLRVFTGKDVIADDFAFRQTKSSDITDGLSNTAAISEMLVLPEISDLGIPAAEHPHLWNRTIRETWWVDGPDALEEFCRRCEYEPITPVSSYYSHHYNLVDYSIGEYGHELPPNRNSCLNGQLSTYSYFNAITASSMHSGGVNVLLVDGSVRFISDSIDRSIWRAMGSRNGNDIVEF